MRLSDKWQDYCLIDTSDGERLERWGDVTLIRPDPQIIWHNLFLISIPAFRLSRAARRSVPPLK